VGELERGGALEEKEEDEEVGGWWGAEGGGGDFEEGYGGVCVPRGCRRSYSRGASMGESPSSETEVQSLTKSLRG
jgi:hypothetical protein